MAATKTKPRKGYSMGGLAEGFTNGVRAGAVLGAAMRKRGGSTDGTAKEPSKFQSKPSPSDDPEGTGDAKAFRRGGRVKKGC